MNFKVEYRRGPRLTHGNISTSRRQAEARDLPNRHNAHSDPSSLKAALAEADRVFANFRSRPETEPEAPAFKF